MRECPASLSPLCSTETSFTRCAISVTAESSIRYLHGTRKTYRSEVAHANLNANDDWKKSFLESALKILR